MTDISIPDQKNLNQNNEKLTGSLISMGHLKIYIKMRYSSLKAAGDAAGISQGRVRQIINGFCLPESPQLIKQIAEGWGIDSIVLTQLFERCKK